MFHSRHKIHNLHFIILLIILTIGASFILLLNHNQPYQIGAVIATSLGYFLWGIAHHYKQNDFHPEIILEYLLMALLGASFLISIILKT